MSDPTTIRLRENGPLIVPANVRIIDHQGNAFTPPAGKDNVALCRCGQSRIKPFCDGSHRACNFVANELAK